MDNQAQIPDLAELKRLADACPPAGNHHFESNEWKAIKALRDEVVRLFGCDVGMVKTLTSEIQALRKEVERLRTAEGDAMTYKAGMENVAQQRDQLKAENEALRNKSIYWQCAPGIGLIRCVSDARYHKFSPRTRMRYSPVLVVADESLRKDAERYRWFRNHSLQIVHASTGPWVHDLDKVIDAAMAESDVFDVPLMCRQRMAAEGLPYPRSSCYSCGQFSPKSRECDELIATRLKGTK